jgi:hypothetical protein
MGESWLHESVCRQRPELLLTVVYMKLFVDRGVNCCESWLQEAACRQRPLLCDSLLHKVWLDRDFNCGWQLVT